MFILDDRTGIAVLLLDLDHPALYKTPAKLGGNLIPRAQFRLARFGHDLLSSV